MKLGHFNDFVKNSTKKVAVGENFGFFLLDTLKTTFWMVNFMIWPKDGHNQGLLYQNQGFCSRFSKKGMGGSEFLTRYFWFNMFVFTAFFRFLNHILNLKALDQPQNESEESLLTRDIK